MSVETFYQFRQGGPRSEFRDFDVVGLTAAVTSDDGDVIPEGTKGTIVNVWRDGMAYVIEFEEPAGAIATVAGEGLRLVERAQP
ncbi:MAG: DUF4926 domain-containing protein [Methylobacterium sp.]|uniref:DUF4926 domain-containing protein n=1 Tax=Methylobacterium sp. TaxID=409 RepID=UPI0025E07E61|nr:DUF4926 domain-containing protein [Methylobacterium sp.]MBX9934552.1 DUF4926 domain-containing protein [Methylobacterium sp.]